MRLWPQISLIAVLSPTTNEVHITKDEKGHTISVSHFEMNV